VCEGLASRVHFALCGCHGKHNKSMVPCVSEIMIKKKKNNFPLNQNMTCANCGSYVATCVICGHAGQTANKFSRIQVIGTNQTSGMTATKWFIAALFIVP